MKLTSFALLTAMLFPCVCNAQTPAAAPAPTPIHVCLMFDDGPSGNTLRLLDELKQAGVCANFDLIGDNVRKQPELAKALAEGGQYIQDHSLQHQHPAELDDAALEADITGGVAAIAEVTGVSPEYYWPPYLETDPRMDAIFKAHNMKLCRLNQVPYIGDWEDKTSAQQIADRAVAGAQDGALLLFHEWRDETVDMMPQIIERLRAKGCVFLTYKQMDAYLQGKGK